MNHTTFSFVVEQFADLRILRYPVSGFEELSIKQKELIYYLSQAAVEGRDILFDQNYKHNLTIRRTLEAVYEHYNGNRESSEFSRFEIFLKRVWFSNGIHHHYSTAKITPGFNADFFKQAVQSIDDKHLPLRTNESKQDLINRLTLILFNPEVAARRVNQNENEDLIATSANHYYDNVSQQEAESFYASRKDPEDKTPVSHGMNSLLTNENGQIVEKAWKIGGIYSPAIEKIVYWLKKAHQVAENDQQKKVISLLTDFYETGDLSTFDQYNIEWLQDQDSRVDFINGFIETYGDPLGLKASWESVVNFKNTEATRRTETISKNAQWFKDHSPIDERFKKQEVRGVSAKVINVAMLGGDCYPHTPIGINLPNADWLRKEYGSKSVTIENITYAYDQAAKGTGFLEEFCSSEEEIARHKKYGFQAGNLHTDLHECLGHGSGQLLDGINGDELKAYGAVIEEARADLFALYYMGDKKLIELELLPDEEAFKAEYDNYIRNGLLTQITRIALGDNIEQAHMRNRQLIASWAFEYGKASNVIEKVIRDGKTFFTINDYKGLRELFATLLAEIQRIKSEGDFESAKNLVERYAVKIDKELHAEVLERYKKLNLAPYSGFVNPVYRLQKDEKDNITDVVPDYTEGYAEQMMRYSREHSWLPDYNS
ncbi:dipeptidyl-peptidase-3 [Marinilabilia salmonicolor]|jgi:dipeptidyl-peptidase-3|uniref:dipeptidyl-peptidase 3 family protein n=1 Tax=Marinilabilia salmonicolor TaxID=989 RepID=UPI000D0756C7|nr:dihydrofolate reductase [Marinilabilia salmonicolor]PRZ00081.1 dipeptidyl-peptidase-3 [Marinilabilia salmonicolor]